MRTKQKADRMLQAWAGVAVGSDAMVAEVAQQVRPESADGAALLFSQAVGMRMVSRWRYGRWWYGLTAEERGTLEAMAAGVARRLELPEGTSTAGVVRMYFAERGVRPKEVRKQVKRVRVRV